MDDYKKDSDTKAELMPLVHWAILNRTFGLGESPMQMAKRNWWDILGMSLALMLEPSLDPRRVYLHG